jgi:hypothetical protein
MSYQPEDPMSREYAKISDFFLGGGINPVQAYQEGKMRRAQMDAMRQESLLKGVQLQQEQEKLKFLPVEKQAKIQELMQKIESAQQKPDLQREIAMIRQGYTRDERGNYNVAPIAAEKLQIEQQKSQWQKDLGATKDKTARLAIEARIKMADEALAQRYTSMNLMHQDRVSRLNQTASIADKKLALAKVVGGVDKGAIAIYNQNMTGYKAFMTAAAKPGVPDDVIERLHQQAEDCLTTANAIAESLSVQTPERQNPVNPQVQAPVAQPGILDKIRAYTPW